MKRKSQTSVWIGTRKGAFVFRSTDRKNWDVDGPFFRGWEVNHVAPDPRDPTRIYAAVNSAWFGPHIHASADGGKSWKPSDEGFELKSVPGAKIARTWHIEPGPADRPGWSTPAPTRASCSAARTGARAGRRSPRSTIT